MRFLRQNSICLGSLLSLRSFTVTVVDCQSQILHIKLPCWRTPPPFPRVTLSKKKSFLFLHCGLSQKYTFPKKDHKTLSRNFKIFTHTERLCHVSKINYFPPQKGMCWQYLCRKRGTNQIQEDESAGGRVLLLKSVPDVYIAFFRIFDQIKILRVFFF